MARDTWRDSDGFGRPEEIGADVWSRVGPDNEDHSIHCSFIYQRGILPCDCDSTRKRFAQTLEGKGIWYARWIRWQQVRVGNVELPLPIKWPITGPDGEPWVPGVDFNDEPEPEPEYHAEWCNVEHPAGRTPCRVVRKLRDSPQA